MRISSIPSTPERCKLLLHQWRTNLNLNNLERTQLAGELNTLDEQIDRLINNNFRIAVFGRVGVGKSSLLNALLEKEIFATDVAHGCTRTTSAVEWSYPIKKLNIIELIDTPGIDEIASECRDRLAKRIAIKSDLIIVVLDSDITSVELSAVSCLFNQGKPILLVLNRCDQWEQKEQLDLIRSIRNRLPLQARKLSIKTVSAAPREVELLSDGRVRSKQCAPRIEALKNSLIKLLEEEGQLLLSLNTLRQADFFSQRLNQRRLKRGKIAAQNLIGRFAAFKASGVALNPLCILDLAGGLACDTALVIQLSKIYGMHLKGQAARKLLKKLSIYNSFLGGAQLSIQFILSLLRQLLLISTPISGGLTLAPATPIALVQAALAVHTTKLTGRLAARELLRSNHQNGAQPRALLIRLASSDPEVKNLLANWRSSPSKEKNNLQALLP